MKLTTLSGAFVAIILGAITSVPNVRAAHATPYLDPLHLAVSNRIADTNIATTTTQKRALLSADRTLRRNSRTLSGDVLLLGSAARTLNPRFTNEFLTLQTDALALYAAEGEAQLDLAVERIGTNRISRGFSNQLVRARTYLDRAEQITNSVTRQASALASALSRIRAVTTPVFRKYPANTNSGPVGAHAPLSLAGKDVDLVETAPVNDQTRYFLDPYSEGGTGNYLADNPEELGQWNYVRTGDNTGVVNLYVDYPGDGADHQITLTFNTPTSGTFTGKNILGQNISGTFSVMGN